MMRRLYADAGRLHRLWWDDAFAPAPAEPLEPLHEALARYKQTHRGTSNTNARGSSYGRRRRKAWLLERFGDGTTAPCHFCGAALTSATLSVDRIVPGCRGGTYKRDNIRPACGTCNSRYGATERAGS